MISPPPFPPKGSEIVMFLPFHGGEDVKKLRNGEKYIDIAI
jgi:hypothetical protein